MMARRETPPAHVLDMLNRRRLGSRSSKVERRECSTLWAWATSRSSGGRRPAETLIVLRSPYSSEHVGANTYRVAIYGRRFPAKDLRASLSGALKNRSGVLSGVWGAMGGGNMTCAAQSPYTLSSTACESARREPTRPPRAEGRRHTTQGEHR